MDEEMQVRIEETVLEILRNSDMEVMTEYKVRTVAADKLGLDLSHPPRKKFVRQVVQSFLLQQQDDEEAATEEEEEVEEEEEEAKSNNNNNKGYDDDGDLVICRLNEKRRVTIQDFRGKTLVSIREYYQKHGKYLPTSKGISLTAEQWSSFKKNVPAIEKAIEKMEVRLD